MKLAWLDVRTAPEAQREAVVDAAVHARVDAIVHDDAELLASLPNTVRRVWWPRDEDAPAHPGLLTVRHVGDDHRLGELADQARSGADDIVALVDVVDDETLNRACRAAASLPYTVVRFKDPTKIPLEIVIAAADRAPGLLICAAEDVEEAQIIIDVLEKGSEGVLIAPKSSGEVFELVRALETKTPELDLITLTVDSIEHVGLGDRVCIDTCTHFEEDEGMLVGSYAHGFILCCSETHPLPYMPTRPFRINAGALHSYVLGQENRTNYLSELQAGSSVLAVGADGRTRRIVVGRIKLESRPLLSIRASAGEHRVNLIVQDDWHVRVLGPGGTVLNSTELKAGDKVLGYLPTEDRHVGYPIAEFCLEK
jgi:3-amino-4-hydroxybenzoic acid synthase